MATEEISQKRYLAITGLVGSAVAACLLWLFEQYTFVVSFVLVVVCCLFFAAAGESAREGDLNTRNHLQVLGCSMMLLPTGILIVVAWVMITAVVFY